MNIYEEDILDHYENPSNYGTLEQPDISYEEDNPLCGDQIRMDSPSRGRRYNRPSVLWPRLHYQPSSRFNADRRD